jgi:hypothetical protein
VDADQQLVDELDHLAGPDRPAQTDVLAERLEDGQGAVEDRLLAADHDGQSAGLRAGRAARDRRVEEVRAWCFELLGAPAVQAGADRGMVDVDLARARPGGHLAEDGLHRVGRRQRGHDDLGALGHLAGRVGGLRARFGQLVHGAARAVVHVHGVARGQQPLRHRSAHLAQADKA